MIRGIDIALMGMKIGNSMRIDSIRIVMPPSMICQLRNGRGNFTGLSDVVLKTTPDYCEDHGFDAVDALFALRRIGVNGNSRVPLFRLCESRFPRSF